MITTTPMTATKIKTMTTKRTVTTTTIQQHLQQQGE